MAADPKLYANDEGIWREDEPGQPFGIIWDEVYCVSGHKLDAMTEVYTCVVFDWEFGEFLETYQNWPGFEEVVSAVTQRLPGISRNWLDLIESLGPKDPPIVVWHRDK